MARKHPDILLINEIEGKADEIAFLCHFFKLHDGHVTARFPVPEYITYLLRKDPKDYVFVDCENIDNGFNVAYDIAEKHPAQHVILIHECQKHQSGYPKNLSIFKTAKEGVHHIKNTLTESSS